MGAWCPPYYGKKKSNFYEKKKAKAISKIAKYETKIEVEKTVVAECNKHIHYENKEVKPNSDKA